ncbi:unnamed protein product [Polarella glacialis]|uniref:Calmodulin n=1 Tax=Polarella glacialis TaxID=89957 RepID=A0A813D8V3_POLGL|nr:unnamed protein product [Polarella glacialis]
MASFSGQMWGDAIKEDLKAGLKLDVLVDQPENKRRHVCASPVDSNAASVQPEESTDHWPEELRLSMDWFQEVASGCNGRRESVLVAAPTSAGKTLVALHAIQRCLDRGERVGYTAPVKALSNQKYGDFVRLFGADKVCLLTGDATAGDPDTAPIVVMTTEVLVGMLHNDRNRAESEDGLIRQMTTAIFDEVHYIADEERGTVWEEAIILLERHISLVCLSATIPNYLELAAWIAQTRHGPCHAVYSGHRPVPLEHCVFPCPPSKEATVIVDKKGRFSARGFQKAIRDLPRRAEANTGNQDEKLNSNSRDRDKELLAAVEECKERKDLPLILFSFSRAECTKAARDLSANLRLKPRARELVLGMVREVVEKHLAPEDRNLDSIRYCTEHLLPRGVGVHHGGLLPVLRELTEQLFQDGHLKILCTTETFAIGVNMPSKAVIFNWAPNREFRKYDGQQQRVVRSGEYRQMSGRAGRRNQDGYGRAISIMACHAELGLVKRITVGEAEKVESKFRLSYSLILRNLRTSRAQLELLTSQSFRQFQTDSSEVMVFKEEAESKLRVLQHLGLVQEGRGLTSTGAALSRVQVAGNELLAACLLEHGLAAMAGVGGSRSGEVLMAFLSCLVNDLEERIADAQRACGCEVQSPEAEMRKLRQRAGFADAVPSDGLLTRVLRRCLSLVREFQAALTLLVGREEELAMLEEARKSLRRGGKDHRALPFLESIYLPLAVERDTLDPDLLKGRNTPCPHSVGDLVWLAPCEIGFAHVSISRAFHRGGHTITSTLKQLLAGEIEQSAIPMLEVYWVEGQYWALANRRLAVFRLFEQNCPERGAQLQVQVVGDERANEWGWANKWTTGLWRGRRIKVRGTGEVIGRTAEETVFHVDWPDVHHEEESPDTGGELTGYARLPRDSGAAAEDDTGTVSGESADDGEEQEAEVARYDATSDAGSDTLYVENCAIALDPRRLCEFLIEREIGENPVDGQGWSNPRHISRSATARDLSDWGDLPPDAPASRAIPDDFKNVHEYLRCFAMPVLEEMVADVRAKLEASELKLGDSAQVSLMSLEDARKRAAGGKTLPKLPKWCPPTEGEGATAEVAALCGIGGRPPKGVASPKELPPFHMGLLYREGHLKHVQALANDAAPTRGAPLSTLQVDGPDDCRLCMVHSTPKAGLAIVIFGRRPGQEQPLAGAELLEVVYNDPEEASKDVTLMEIGSLWKASRVREDGRAWQLGVRVEMFLSEHPEGWDGTPPPAAIAEGGHDWLGDRETWEQRQPTQQRPGDRVRLVFEGAGKQWRFAKLDCNACTAIRVAQALSTPELHHPVFWQREISGCPDGESSAWTSTAANSCNSMNSRSGSDGDEHLERSGLNESQRAAVEELVGCPHGVRLVQGPPGTGKTQTLSVLLDAFAALSLGLAGAEEGHDRDESLAAAEEAEASGDEETTAADTRRRRSPQQQRRHINRCHVGAPTNIACREIATRLVGRLKLRASFSRAMLSQVALIAEQERANVTWGDTLSDILLDHKKKRVKRIARFWLGEGHGQAILGLEQMDWVHQPGLDPLAALLEDPQSSDKEQRRQTDRQDRQKLSVFIRSSFGVLESKLKQQVAQLLSDVPLDTEAFWPKGCSGKQLKELRLEQKYIQKLKQLRAALDGLRKSIQQLRPQLDEAWASLVDSAYPRAPQGQGSPWGGAALQQGPSSSGSVQAGLHSSGSAQAWQSSTRTSGADLATLDSAYRSVENAAMGRTEDVWALSELAFVRSIAPVSGEATADSYSEEEIRKAYKKLCLLIHPDKAPSEFRTRATVAFQSLEEAWSAVLRKVSDSEGRSWGSSAQTRSADREARPTAVPAKYGPGVQEAFNSCAPLQQAFQQMGEQLVKLRKVASAVRSANSPLLKSAMLRHCVLVFSTVSVSGRPVLAQQRIPTLLLDEACQCCEAETIIALRSYVERLFLIGDPRQLPATVTSTAAKMAGYGRSMFERLERIGRNSGALPSMLETQYRMDPPILTWPNETFYGSRIRTAEELLLSRSAAWPSLAMEQLIPCDRHRFGAFRLFDTGLKEWREARIRHTFQNPGEARFILQLLRDFHRLCQPGVDVTVGIIAPYKGQVELLTDSNVLQKSAIIVEHWGLPFMSISRVKNEAKPQEVMRVMRACYKSLDLHTFNMADFGLVIQNHIVFLRQCLLVTRRPNEGLLEQAGLLAFPENPSTVKLFASQLCKAVQNCRQKKGKITNGTRQIPEVLEIIKLLETESSVSAESSPRTPSRSPPPGESLSRRAPSSSSLDGIMVSPGRILASYGLKATSSHAVTESREILEIYSSQEAHCSQCEPPALPAPKLAAAISRPTATGQVTIYLDSSRRALVRVIDGQMHVAEMFTGPAGFAMGRFPGEIVEYSSEMPNLLLGITQAKKQPKKLKVLKKPAAKAKSKAKAKAKSKSKARAQAQEQDEEEEEEEEEEEKQPDDEDLPATQEYPEEQEAEEEEPPLALAIVETAVVRAYGKMWHKNTKSYGIRQKFLANKQIFTVRSKDGSMKQNALMAVADAALYRLNTSQLSEQQWIRRSAIVSTVDGFQGNERDRRLNVAVTRARRKVWIVGDVSHLSWQHQENNGYYTLVPFARRRGWVVPVDPVTSSPGEQKPEAALPQPWWSQDLMQAWDQQKEVGWMQARYDKEYGLWAPFCALCGKGLYNDTGHLQKLGHAEAIKDPIAAGFGSDGAFTIYLDDMTEDIEGDSGDLVKAVVFVEGKEVAVLEETHLQALALGNQSVFRGWNETAPIEFQVREGCLLLEADGDCSVDWIRRVLSVSGHRPVHITVAPPFPKPIVPAYAPGAVQPTVPAYAPRAMPSAPYIPGSTPISYAPQAVPSAPDIPESTPIYSSAPYIPDYAPISSSASSAYPIVPIRPTALPAVPTVAASLPLAVAVVPQLPVGYPGARWQSRYNEVPVLVRAGSACDSKLLATLSPESQQREFEQVGQWVSLDNGVVRMPVSWPAEHAPRGWATADARAVPGPRPGPVFLRQKHEGAQGPEGWLGAVWEVLVATLVVRAGPSREDEEVLSVRKGGHVVQEGPTRNDGGLIRIPLMLDVGWITVGIPDSRGPQVMELVNGDPPVDPIPMLPAVEAAPAALMLPPPPPPPPPRPLPQRVVKAPPPLPPGTLQTSLARQRPQSLSVRGPLPLDNVCWVRYLDDLILCVAHHADAKSLWESAHLEMEGVLGDGGAHEVEDSTQAMLQQAVWDAFASSSIPHSNQHVAQALVTEGLHRGLIACGLGGNVKARKAAAKAALAVAVHLRSSRPSGIQALNVLLPLAGQCSEMRSSAQ